MVRGQFTKEQNDHIESLMPDFVVEMDRGVSGIALTRWKQGKASIILDSPMFATLDLQKNPRQTWFTMIVRKFTNYRNQVYYLKTLEPQSSPALPTKKANPLLKFSSITSGRELFAHSHRTEIGVASKQRLLDTEHKSPAAVYQIILKEKWDALSSKAQCEWNSRAEEEAANIVQNQQEFATTMTLALQDLCRGNLLGDAEMVLFYGFREPDTGDLAAGTIHAHCAHNRLHFGGGNEEMQLLYGAAWSEFAEDVIPRPVALNPAIPRNSSGCTVFPSMNVDNIPIAELRMLLSDYFDQCWAYRCSDAKVISIPWEAIASNPEKHYDCAFSVKLNHPQNLSTIKVIQLSQDLLATSVIDSPTPFRFLEPEEEILIPTTPLPPAPTPVQTSVPLVISEIPLQPSLPPDIPPKSPAKNVALAVPGIQSGKPGSDEAPIKKRKRTSKLGESLGYSGIDFPIPTQLQPQHFRPLCIQHKERQELEQEKVQVS
ncbi:hypothetical protein B0H19DRAFT_1273868 [Mycena capillaripes]|nr:hypothetical protein B0H19DRAFT_1273868 [Mycena capillaripes]